MPSNLVKVALSIFCCLANTAYACSCLRFNEAEPSTGTLVKVRILDSGSSIGPGDKFANHSRASVKYQVEVVDKVRGNFPLTYIFSGRGGGDCGIRFQKGEVFTFHFKELSDQHPPLVLMCGWFQRHSN